MLNDNRLSLVLESLHHSANRQSNPKPMDGWTRTAQSILSCTTITAYWRNHAVHSAADEVARKRNPCPASAAVRYIHRGACSWNSNRHLRRARLQTPRLRCRAAHRHRSRRSSLPAAHNPRVGAPGISYGPFRRQNGLALAVAVTNGHNTSQGTAIPEGIARRLRRSACRTRNRSLDISASCIASRTSQETGPTPLSLVAAKHTSLLSASRHK